MGSFIQPGVNDYKTGFQKFEAFIEQINNESSAQNQNNKAYEGYIVDYDKFTQFKNSVNNLSQNPNTRVDFQQNFPQKLETENLEEVKKQIDNNHRFIIIGEDIYKLICNKDSPNAGGNKINYTVNPESLILINKNGIQLQFKNNHNNIIDKSTILEPQGNINNINSNPPIQGQVSQNVLDNWERRYTDCFNYYENEIDIISKQNSPIIQTFQGFLVDKEWVDKWIKYSYYETIKENIFKKNMNNAETIKNYIISEHSKQQLNYDLVNDVDVYIIKNESQMRTLSSLNKPHALLNLKFLKQFQTSAIPSTNFNIFNQNVSARLSNGQTLPFKANGNILYNLYITTSTNQTGKPSITQTNQRYRSDILQHLIRFYFFKKELISQTNNSQNGFCLVNVINSQIIKKFKDIYHLKEIYEFIDNNIRLKGITYQNCDNNYSLILEEIYKTAFLNNDQIRQYENKGGINFTEKENCLEIKKFNNQPNLEYIEDFEIIDQNFAKFLNQKFGGKLIMTPACYSKIKDMIFMIIKLDKTYALEIVSSNPQDKAFIMDYLIEVVTMNIPISSQSLINSLHSYFIKYEIKYKRNTFYFNNNIPVVFDLHTKNKKLVDNSANMRVSQNNNSISQIQSTTITDTAPNQMINKQQMDEIFKDSYFLIDNELWQLIVNYSYNKNNPLLINKIQYLQSLPLNAKELDTYKIKKGEIKMQNQVYNYPKGFSINTRDNFVYMNNLLNNKTTLSEEIYLFQIKGGLIFIPKQNSLAFSDELIYINSTISDGQNNTTEPLYIIICNDINDRNNKFIEISKKANGNFTIQNIVELGKNLNCPCYSLKDLTRTNNINEFNPNYPNYNANNVNNISENKNQIINPTQNALMTPTLNTNNINNNQLVISDKLKVLVLLATLQLYPQNINKLEKVHMFNPKWLEELEFEKIQTLVNKKNKEITGQWKASYDLNSLLPIFQFLDNEKLKKYDSYLKNNPKISWEAIPKQITLLDKVVYLYETFVLVNDIMFNLIQKYFTLTPNNYDISYINLNNQGDLIIFKNHPIYVQNYPNQVQIRNLILYGNINK